MIYQGILTRMTKCGFCFTGEKAYGIDNRYQFFVALLLLLFFSLIFAGFSFFRLLFLYGSFDFIDVFFRHLFQAPGSKAVNQATYSKKAHRKVGFLVMIVGMLGSRQWP